MTDDALRTLDAYLAALRAMPNSVGDAVRAIDRAEAANLPPLELHLAGDLAQSVDAGETERAWLARHAQLATRPALAGVSHADAPHRLAQAVALLHDAGVWPWE